MKKIILPLLILMIGSNLCFGAPVPVETAKEVAENFYKQNSKKVIRTTTLTYTELSPSGKPVYYVFSINQNDGYVIVPADNNEPIKGFALQGTYVVPSVAITASTEVVIKKWDSSGWAVRPKKG